MKSANSYGKINLFLDVVKTYKNGYHKIKSIFIETSLFDVIQYEKNNLGSVRVFDKTNALPEDNLLKKAADKFVSLIGKTPFGVDFHIEKKIPIGGGMGGGSANAASVLKILNSIWKINYSRKKLQSIGKLIGADVPFFIKGGVQKVTGIGDILTPLKADKFKLDILLILPEISVSTVSAYKFIDDNNLSLSTYENNKKFKNLVYGIQIGNRKMIIENIYNKFETVVFEEFPILNAIKEQLLKVGADAAFMSGSGSTMVGIFNGKQKTVEASNFFNGQGYQTFVI